MIHETILEKTWTIYLIIWKCNNNLSSFFKTFQNFSSVLTSYTDSDGYIGNLFCISI